MILLKSQRKCFDRVASSWSGTEWLKILFKKPDFSFYQVLQNPNNTLAIVCGFLKKFMIYSAATTIRTTLTADYTVKIFSLEL